MIAEDVGARSGPGESRLDRHLSSGAATLHLGWRPGMEQAVGLYHLRVTSFLRLRYPALFDALLERVIKLLGCENC